MTNRTMTIHRDEVGVSVPLKWTCPVTDWLLVKFWERLLSLICRCLLRDCHWLAGGHGWRSGNQALIGGRCSDMSVARDAILSKRRDGSFYAAYPGCDWQREALERALCLIGWGRAVKCSLLVVLQAVRNMFWSVSELRNPEWLRSNVETTPAANGCMRTAEVCVCGDLRNMFWSVSEYGILSCSVKCGNDTSSQWMYENSRVICKTVLSVSDYGILSGSVKCGNDTSSQWMYEKQSVVYVETCSGPCRSYGILSGSVKCGNDTSSQWMYENSRAVSKRHAPWLILEGLLPMGQGARNEILDKEEHHSGGKTGNASASPVIVLSMKYGPMKQSPMKYGPMKQSPMKHGPMKQSPMKYGPTKQSPMKYGPMKQSPMKYGPMKQSPMKYMKYGPMKQSPMKYGPMKQSPMKYGPMKQSPMKYGPMKQSPMKYGPMKQSPMKYGPMKQSPMKHGPMKQSPTIPHHTFTSHAVNLLASHQGDPGSIPGRVTPDLRMGASCQTIPLIDWPSRGSPVYLALSFRSCSVLTSITLIGSLDLDVKRRPNLFTHIETSESIQASVTEAVADNCFDGDNHRNNEYQTGRVFSRALSKENREELSSTSLHWLDFGRTASSSVFFSADLAAFVP
ncbi:hypothetical protein PR048_020589 [Dryococelus australis]|uniref:Uncharacterized protein n=1 Tax=Dryococelus australis TaxID=614101 RepID=A0ABQ9H744_9NEOP|nr:hypothetical protein PR048_020589 [Dryococelus australis]